SPPQLRALHLDRRALPPAPTPPAKPCFDAPKNNPHPTETNPLTSRSTPLPGRGALCQRVEPHRTTCVFRGRWLGIAAGRSRLSAEPWRQGAARFATCSVSVSETAC